MTRKESYKMAKKEKVKKVKDPNKKSLWAEFKEFINKGNAFMLAVGVVIGGAFNAIVTALVNILMSVATWAVPGGLKGLVTVLPAFPGSAAQKGAQFLQDEGIVFLQKFDISEANQRVIEFAAAQGKAGLTVESADFIQWKTSLLGLYTLHGTTYTYNMSAVIDWGTFINAVIAFIIIALTLFVIVKTTTVLAKKREEAKAKIEAKVKKEDKEGEAEEAPAEEEAK